MKEEINTLHKVSGFTIADRVSYLGKLVVQYETQRSTGVDLLANSQLQIIDKLHAFESSVMLASQPQSVGTDEE